MQARHEITNKFARRYKQASKKTKGRVLDEVCAITGWSRDNARRQLTAASTPRRVKSPPRKPRALKYSADAIKILHVVWAAAGGLSGKYLAQAMRLHLRLLEDHGELVFDTDGYSREVRAELLAMSAATIDRYLAPARKRYQLRGIATTRPGPLLRSSITIRKAGDEIERVPGFFEGDTVAHCGPTTRGEYVRTVDLTDMLTGWTYTRAVRNNAHVHIRDALDRFIAEVPYEVTGVDFDNGSEFINHATIAWAAELEIYFTRARPYKKNDQATVESKHNHVVRRYAFHWRYDTPKELRALNQLWALVNDRHNYMMPTKKPIRWSTDASGRRKRAYDKPATPLERLIRAGVISDAEIARLREHRDSLNPAQLARDIDRLQQQLTGMAAAKTRRLETLEAAKQPDTTKGVKPAPKRAAS